MKNRSSTFSSKKKSVTSETRLSHSNIFNNSSLLQAKLMEQPQQSPYRNLRRSRQKKENCLSHQIRKSENKEIDFLRIKNEQLQEKNSRLTACVVELETEKRGLLEMNKKYVAVVNQYYVNQEKKYKEVRLVPEISQEVVKVLEGLEKDHRNLIKHCLVMEDQIKNYAREVEKYHEMMDQLHSANHTNVNQLLGEIFELAQDNKQLKKQNNRLNYEIQKTTGEVKALKNVSNGRQQQISHSLSQIEKMKSLMNTVQQKSDDKARAYEATIYDLQLKVERLEKELRQQQQNLIKQNQGQLRQAIPNQFGVKRDSMGIDSCSKSVGRKSNKAIIINNNLNNKLRQTITQERKMLSLK